MIYYTLEHLQSLPTPRLLSYFKSIRGMKYRAHGKCPTCGDGGCEIYKDEIKQDKECQKCLTYINIIKGLLDSREHV